MTNTNGFFLNKHDCDSLEVEQHTTRRRCKFGGELPKGLLLAFTIQEFVRDLRAQGFECKFNEREYADYKRLLKKMEGLLTALSASLPAGVGMPRSIERVPYQEPDKASQLN